MGTGIDRDAGAGGVRRRRRVLVGRARALLRRRRRWRRRRRARRRRRRLRCIASSCLLLAPAHVLAAGAARSWRICHPCNAVETVKEETECAERGAALGAIRVLRMPSSELFSPLKKMLGVADFTKLGGIRASLFKSPSSPSSSSLRERKKQSQRTKRRKETEGRTPFQKPPPDLDALLASSLFISFKPSPRRRPTAPSASRSCSRPRCHRTLRRALHR